MITLSEFPRLQAHNQMEQAPRELIEQGAEAKVYKITYNGKPAVLKERVPKTYRHPLLDKKIAKERIQLETKNMIAALKYDVVVPQVYTTDLPSKTIVMEYIDGVKMKDWFNHKHSSLEIRSCLASIGQSVMKLHQKNIIHGDLTTSNMILRGQQVCLIDFGLSYSKNSNQDKAVDLYVLERAFVSTHPNLEPQFRFFYEGYTTADVLKRLQAVRQRGRKKVAFG